MQSKMKATCICAVLTLSLLATGCGKEIEVKNGSKVAVSVTGEKITATEYYEKMKEDNIATLVDMIDTGFLSDKYKDSDEEKEYVENQVSQIKSYYGSDETTYKSILQSYFGVQSEEELREKIKLDYKRTQAINDYIKNHLTDKEIEDYYNDKISGEIEASHILITADVASTATDEEKEEAEAKALKTAQNIIKKLNNGEDFAKLAKKNSKDEGSASNGGSLGYFQPSDMVSEFADAVIKLKVNEYTKEPVKTSYGYHIILKTGEKDKPELKDVKDEIKEKLAAKKLSEDSTLRYKTLVSVREENKISWNDSVLEKAYNDYMDRLIESASSQS